MKIAVITHSRVIASLFAKLNKIKDFSIFIVLSVDNILFFQKQLSNLNLIFIDTAFFNSKKEIKNVINMFSKNKVYVLSGYKQCSHENVIFKNKDFINNLENIVKEYTLEDEFIDFDEFEDFNEFEDKEMNQLNLTHRKLSSKEFFEKLSKSLQNELDYFLEEKDELVEKINEILLYSFDEFMENRESVKGILQELIEIIFEFPEEFKKLVSVIEGIIEIGEKIKTKKEFVYFMGIIDDIRNWLINIFEKEIEDVGYINASLYDSYLRLKEVHENFSS